MCGEAMDKGERFIRRAALKHRLGCLILIVSIVISIVKLCVLCLVLFIKRQKMKDKLMRVCIVLVMISL